MPAAPPRASAASRATSSGSGRRKTETTSGGGEHADGAEHERPGQGRARPTAWPARPATPVRFGPGHRPDRGGPDHHGQRAGPLGRAGQVGRGVAGLVVGGRRRAEQRGADQQQGERAHDPGHHAEHGAGGTEQVAQGQPHPAPAPAHHVGEQEGRDRGAEHLHGLRQPGELLAAGDLLGEQRGDGDADAHAEPAERLRDDQRPDRAALHLRAAGGPASAPRRTCRAPPQRPRRPPSRRSAGRESSLTSPTAGGRVAPTPRARPAWAAPRRRAPP